LARSKALVYMSDMLTATQAHELGIVWKVTEGRADDAALEAARILAGRDPAALVAAKQGLQDAGADAMAHALQREWRLAAAGTAPDAPMACKDRGGRT
jgi:enoyl-CoA hydratase/carnithine racemase